ncbi:MAG: ATP-binding cassette domain-containing protein, partial [Nitrospinae bacterium]|nr:ATP-binding cassette domain-containing protein [Nitrospinota bacterium]
LDEHVPEDKNPDGEEMGRLSRHIRFEGVHFSYSDEATLEDINIEVPAGCTLAVVGMSGAGKSTFLDLIPRFYPPARGRISFDGKEASRYSLSSLRAQIAVVTQQVILFNDTAENNIAYGEKRSVSREEIISAAKAANAHDFIMELENGYETMLGEEGVRLSGGERQRIAIARAILRDPSILLLDEATSALDTESEQLIQDALEPLMKDRTTFVVAHRLSTVRNADLIIVLDGGRIVERGTHDELMKRGGLYQRLYEMQFVSEEMSLSDEIKSATHGGNIS